MTLVVDKNNEVSTIDDINFESKMDLVRKMYCKGCSDNEIEVFTHVCRRTGLDPLAKQIYPIKRGGVLTIQTGIDGLRLIAERTGNYSPGRESTFTYDEKGNLLCATSYIKKRTSDNIWHEVAACAYFEEYNARQGLWQKMPRAMLSKCAEALALRKAFPAEMSGLYTQDEMDQASKEIEDAKTPAAPLKTKEEISEEEWAKLDMLALSISDQEYLKKLAEFVKVDTLYDIQPKDYERVIRSLERKSKEKEVINESADVA